MLKLLDERAERHVIDLAPPEMRHAEKVQVLDTDRTILTTEFVARLPLPVIAAVMDTLMAALQVFALATPGHNMQYV